jgi:transposase
MTMLAETIDGVIGVDTHRDTLTAAAVTAIGGLLDHATAATDATGYRELLAFAAGQVPGRRCWAIEGAGSFGAGLATFLLDHGEQVIEVPRRRRSTRRTAAKSDPWTPPTSPATPSSPSIPPSCAAAATARPSGCC